MWYCTEAQQRAGGEARCESRRYARSFVCADRWVRALTTPLVNWAQLCCVTAVDSVEWEMTLQEEVSKKAKI